MYKQLLQVICIIVVIGLFGGTAAGNTYTDDGPEHNWCDPCNWSQGVPEMGVDPGSWANMTVDDTLLILDGGCCDPNASGLYPGCYGADSDLYIEPGGSLRVQHLNIGRGFDKPAHAGSKGYLLMTGGTVHALSGMEVPNQAEATGPPAEGHVDMSGGTITLDGYFHIGPENSDGTGSVNMTGGTINAPILFMRRNSHLDLHGGIVELTPYAETEEVLSMDWSNASMDITEGELVIAGRDVVDQIQSYISDAKITAYNGSGDLDLVYDDANTILTAYLDPNKAQEPSPAHGADNVAADVVYSWKPGAKVQDVNAHELYIGSNKQAVAEANSTSHPGVDYYQLDTNSMGPLSYGLDQTWYWRVDEANDPCMWQGYAWQFTTANYKVVDEFESYTGDSDLTATWSSSGNTGGITLGEAHNGEQGMLVDVSANAAPESPAVVERGLSSEDWTTQEIKALSIWCKANANAGQLTVTLNNGGKAQTKADISTGLWQELNFDLSEFGVDLSSVSNIAFEVTADGGDADVYIDDIRIYPCRPGGLTMDLNDDCVVGLQDFALFVDRWLDAKYFPENITK